MSHVLAATDLSARSERAVERAASLADTLGMGLRLLHVVDDAGPAAFLDRRRDEAEEVLANAVAASETLTARAPKVTVETGHPVARIVAAAHDPEAALLVLGSHRSRGVGELLGVPSLVRVVRAVDIPVLVAVGPVGSGYTRVVAGHDFSPAAEAAIGLARRIAPDAAMRVIHAWQDTMLGSGYGIETGALHRAAGRQETGALERAVASLPGGADMRSDCVEGGAVSALLGAVRADQADLLAVGRHARSGIARFFLGDTAEQLALDAPCDVLLSPAG